MSKLSVFPFSAKVLELIDSFSFDYRDPVFNFSGSFEVFLSDQQVIFYLDSAWLQLKDGNFHAIKVVRSRFVAAFPEFSDFQFKIVFAL